MPQLLDKKAKEEKPKEDYSPEVGSAEKNVLDHLTERIVILKDSKKKILDDINFEEIMQDADNEYMPKSLREKVDKTGSVMLVQDEVRGLRGSRIVPITGKEGNEWRSDVSEPTLFVKIQTALSILVDQNPEAVFKAMLDRYKSTSAVAKAIWQRSWNIAGSKEMLKLFIFDLAKYGWAIGRTYPRLVERDKEILVELDLDDPSKNKYKKVKIVEFNDIYREKLDPYRTWIDDKANMTDPYSLDDWYFEMDFSKDDFEREFGQYANASLITFGQVEVETKEEEPANDETKKRTDMVTVGFYESKNKDLYAIFAPKQKIVIYFSPLPNDEGMLSCWDAVWNIRDPRTRYGVGLFEIIKNNKVLYDRLDNMDIDQLVLSIYTMLFYSGTNQMSGDGTIVLSPGVAKQKLPGSSIDQVKIDYTGKGREGAASQMERIDEISGITPTLQGEVEGKTLGEVLHAKDSALKRLNIPLGNIGHAIEQDAYLTLSWANQVYSLPEVMEFVDQAELDEYKLETGREPSSMQFETPADEEAGTPASGKITADFPRVLELPLEKETMEENREGALIESPESRFFVVGGTGEDALPKKSIRWKGKVTVMPQSIVAPSQELERQRKMELYNIVQPVVQTIALAMAQGQFQVALDTAKPVVQILEIQNEKPENWLPDSVVELLDDPSKVQQLTAAKNAAMNAAKPLMVAEGEVGKEVAPEGTTAPSEQAPSLEGVAPKDEITNSTRDSVEAIGANRSLA